MILNSLNHYESRGNVERGNNLLGGKLCFFYYKILKFYCPLIIIFIDNNTSPSSVHQVSPRVLTSPISPSKPLSLLP